MSWKMAPLFLLIIITIELIYFWTLKINKSLTPALPISTFSKIEKETPIPQIRQTNIIITGDVMLGRGVEKYSLQRNDYNYPFKNVGEALKEGHITFVNLENPIIDDCPITDSGLKFCASPFMIHGLKNAGVDVVSIANNHIENYGKDGSNQTKKYLNEAGIDYVNQDKLVVRNINGTKFGFLGLNFVGLLPKEADFNFVSDSKSKSDILFVMVHWGNEYAENPTDLQKSIAEKLISAGADAVFGSHPHWIQPMEYINEKPIFYSLGNFIFDQMWSEETKKGLVIRMIYEGTKLLSIEELPIYMTSFAQPNWIK